MDPIKICILGDVCPTEDYKSRFDAHDEALFGKVLKLMKDADLTICNFECAATKNQEPSLKCGPSLKAEPDHVAFLKEAGVDLCSLANNHIKDYGTAGVLDTLDECRRQEMLTVGAGEAPTEAAEPVFVKIKDKTIGIISFAEEEFNIAYKDEPGANKFDPYVSFNCIQAMKKKCDYAVVLYHGGIEHYIYPSPLLQKKCRKMIDSGADLVLCQHSHCIGTEEAYGGGRILYGQGNSVFGFRSGSKAWNEGLLVQIELGEKADITYRLLNADENGIDLAAADTEKKRLEKLKQDSEQILDPRFVEQSWKEYALSQSALDLPLLYGKGRIFNKLNRILHNRLMNLTIRRKKRIITMNLIRCDAHREVVQTILENWK